MKQTRKLLAMLLCIAMVLGMATTVFAANTNPHTITITHVKTGHTYEAYQIFAGDMSNADNKLVNIVWGTGVDGAALLSALKDDATIGELFTDAETADDVANVIAAESFTADMVDAFAEIVGAHLTTTVAGTSDETDAGYIINVTGDGYYLVKDKNETVDNEYDSYTKYILKVVENVEVNHKGTVPEVEKKIVVGDSEVDANTADIGDTINYKITGTLPSNIDEYDTYYYVFHDTMSDGLTYTNNVTVTVNGVDVTAYFYKNVTVTEATDEAEATTNIVVGIPDLLALELIADVDPETEGAQIVGNITSETEVILTYTALVNEKANIGVTGDTNEVKLQFSNNPSVDGEGATTPPEEPGDDDEMPDPQVPTGETPKDIVKTYTTEIKITKIDGKDNNPLTGAKFSISGYSSQVMVVNKEMFVQDNNGNYYRLKDGSYTTTVPVFTDEDPEDGVDPVNSDSYDLVDGVALKYKKVDVVSTETITVPFVAEGWVNADGVITFTGLGEGTYTITELVAPDGYNELEAPIVVIISSSTDLANLKIVDGDEEIEWGATVDGEEATINEDGVVEIEVKNYSGSTLPETGGIGTTLFYVFGGIMVLGAAVLLVTKKRMNA